MNERPKRKERFTPAIESSIDREFAKMGITTYVHHMRGSDDAEPMPGHPCATTVASTGQVDHTELHRLVMTLQMNWNYSSQTEHLNHYMFSQLVKRGFPGVSICACNDEFNPREGQIRAKRRLISDIVHCRGIPVETDSAAAPDVARLTSQLDSANGAVARYMSLSENLNRRIAALRVSIADRDETVTNYAALAAACDKHVEELRSEIERVRASRGRQSKVVMGLIDKNSALKRDVQARNTQINDVRDVIDCATHYNDLWAVERIKSAIKEELTP